MKKNNIEDLFKDSFENFEADVNPSVWKNVQTGLKGAGLGLLGKMLINKLGSSAIVAIVSSAAAVLATVFVMNGTGNKTETKSKTTGEPKVIAEAEKPSVDEIKNFLATDNNKGVTDNKAKTEAPVVKNEAKDKNTNDAVKAKNDKKAIEALISDNNIATISSSCVGGAVPLIISLSNIGNGKINKWTFDDGTKPMIGAEPVKYFDEPGIYTITLTSTNADGVTAIDSIKVEALANSSITLPSEFSPNNDGKNDVFVFNRINVSSYTITIVDKNATVVYDYSGTDGKWDGNMPNGKKAKDGIYYYLVSAVGKDGKTYEKKGKINLKR